jgi:pantoate--beta-alanine ligase
MEIITSTANLKLYRSKPGIEGGMVGFVPTMGALHSGHLSLVEAASKHSDSVIVSIFVNPTQFNDPNDLRNYPRNLEKDIALLTEQGKTCAVFTPEVIDIYPEPDSRIFDFGSLDKVMEGAHRPGHFNGVAQVVSRLFEIVEPGKAFFGQKDFQQLAVIRELVKQFFPKIEIISCPIIRENDGLAMSSRNQLLSSEERTHAANISKILFKSMELVKSLEVNKLVEWVINEINNDPLLQVEYFQIVDSQTLMPIEKWNQPGDKQACVAVKAGKVRLIDNIKFD